MEATPISKVLQSRFMKYGKPVIEEKRVTFKNGMYVKVKR